MSLVGAEIKVAFRYTYLGQKCENVQSYICQGAAFLVTPMSDVLLALWNDYKDRLRALTMDDTSIATWDSLLGTEVGGGLAFAEFPVPPGEQAGTRVIVGLGDAVNSFTAGGFRQTVGTRVTRPGQKRFPFLVESDLVRQALQNPYIPLLTDVATAFCNPSALGAPVVGGVLQPIIVHEPTTLHPTRAVQNVTGFVVNTNATSQISRKLGRGQ